MSRPQDPHRSFFPFGNPFRMISPKRMKKLTPKNNNELLNLSWITLAVELHCEIHNDIKTPITNLELPVFDWDENWIDVYLDISVKLLDLSIALNSEISHLNQGHLLLQCALQNLDSASSTPFVQAYSSLDGWW